jgi:glycosyltransferase involved in cell wall biosynthesis
MADLFRSERSGVRFCMITTFYGAHSFGGDAVFVDRLVRALARRGHEVEVVHCADAFEAVRGNEPLRPFEPPAGVVVHELDSRFGVLSPLWTHQTGRLGPKARPSRRVLEQGRFDVIHFHNVSLAGGPQLLALGSGSDAVRLMSAHEYWLVCPMHVLWKYDRAPCVKPNCVACSLRGRRPPQLWRYTPVLDKALRHVDAVVCPSRFSVDVHERLGVDSHLVHIPYFLPDDWAALAEEIRPAAPRARPYLAAAGRLVALKGFQELIPLMSRLPELDLRIAGVGREEPALRRLADGLPNVRFEGLLESRGVAALFRDARAVVAPSLSWETFCYVALESFAVGTPVIARNRGALPELIGESRGGLVFDSDSELLDAVRRLGADDRLRSELGERAQAAVARLWSEEGHVERYLGLVDEVARRRGLRSGAEDRSRPGATETQPLAADRLQG